jgi:hypothetical protein
MTLTLVQKIARIRELALEKGYNDEFILSGMDYKDGHWDPVAKRQVYAEVETPHWRAGVSNPVGAVCLGESEPEIDFESDTIEGAIDGLLAKMEEL